MITTGTIPKALQGGKMKKATKALQSGMTAADIMRADKKADAKMTPAMIKKDIASDKKLLASKTKRK